MLFQFGAADTNVDTANSVQRLDRLQRSNFRIEVYEGSGHALEQPPNRGDALIRPEALDDLTSSISEAATQHRNHTHPPDDPEGDETVAIIEGVADGKIGEDELTACIAERLE